MEEAVMSGAERRTVDSGRGLAWWSEAWMLFMKNPGMWLVFGLVVLVGFVVLNFIPLIGGLAAAVLMQVIVGGWVLCARKLDAGETIDVNNLLDVFKDKNKLTPLLVLGVLAAVGSLVIGVVVAVLGGGALFGLAAGAGVRSTGGMMAGAALGMLAVLVGLAMGFVLGMALWFAAALVTFRGLAPVDALKASWAASLANIIPFLVYGLLWIVAAAIASIPFMLGWLVLAPLTMLGIYVSYKDIFEGAPTIILAPGQQ